VPPAGIKGKVRFAPAAGAEPGAAGPAGVMVIRNVLDTPAPLASFALKVISLNPWAEGWVKQLIYRLEVMEQETTPGLLSLAMAYFSSCFGVLSSPAWNQRSAMFGNAPVFSG